LIALGNIYQGSKKIMEETPQLLELTSIKDTFSTGCDHVEIVGSCARIYIYTDQASLGSGELERILVAKIVMPVEKVPAALKICAAGIAGPGPHSILAKEMVLNMGQRGH
jgi:hypothetical protein